MAALSSSFFSASQVICVSFKVDRPRLLCSTWSWRNNITTQRFGTPLKRKNMKMFDLMLEREANQISTGFSFPRTRNTPRRKSSGLHASWMPCAQFANGAFTVGTAAVFPFYALMIVAPRAKLTKEIIASNIPYMVLGVLYGYLLFLSWTPDTMRTIFATKYLLPELPGIVKMFSSEMTMASAWIHLLTVDLFAARQVYGDGLQNNIETRHSVSLCLLCCPIGILAHAITKALTRERTEEKKTEFTIEEEAIL